MKAITTEHRDQLISLINYFLALYGYEKSAIVIIVARGGQDVNGENALGIDTIGNMPHEVILEIMDAIIKRKRYNLPEN